MSVTATCSDKKREILFDGDLTAQYAVEIQESLLKALKGAEEIRVSFGAVTNVDLAGLQLLCSLHRTATGSNKKISCIASDFVRAAAVEAGYDRLNGCCRDDRDSCFWKRRSEEIR